MYGEKIKVLKVGLPGFKFQPGLQTWQFLTQKPREEVQEIDEAKQNGQDNNASYFYKYENLSEVPEDVLKQGSKTKIVRETMFASNYDQSILNELSKCCRVMPHHQNTSGFFITIIQKL